MFALECSSFEQINHTTITSIQIFHWGLNEPGKKKTATHFRMTLFLHSMYTMSRLQFDELFVLWVPIEFTRLNYEHRHMKTLTPKWYSYGRIYLYKSMTSVELCVFSVSKTFAAIQLYIAFVLSNMLCSLSI